MTPGEFREFAKTMREFGIAKVKIGNIEFTVENEKISHKKIGDDIAQCVTLESAPGADDPIQHKVEQLSSLLKLGDAELVDQLFPDHIEQDESD